ncbi:MAG: phosphate acyltransferase PlsX [Candidatus Sericytochromatia bacterium]|nr:phosphate acyltransferase PlsX [Candidatus Tanganyikabacteria bacterium]
MGGDHAPAEVVHGAVVALRQDPHVRLQLVGDEPRIRQELAIRENALAPAQNDRLALVYAPEVIGMSEAAAALRKKRGASIMVAMDQVREGRAQAVVAAGSTGAAMSAALLRWGRIKGVERPAIAAVLPTIKGPCVLLDLGANVDCKPEWLMQFALMGTEYSRMVLKVTRPRVGVLNIGEEPEKGDEKAVAFHNLLRAEAERQGPEPTWDFAGNVEGRAIWQGAADVVVTDGFTGNVVLKTAEGVAALVTDLLVDEIRRGGLRAKLGALLMKGAFRGLKRRTDPAEYGGALLLGVEGVCVICHGSSKGYAVANAVRVAREAVAGDYLSLIRERVGRAEAETEAGPTRSAL